MKSLIEKAYQEIGEDIENLNFKEATDKAIKLIDDANKFYDDEKPWIQFKEDIEAFNNTIFTCATLIANISNIMEPFMPASSAKIRKIFGMEKAEWHLVEINSGIKLDNVEVLFTRLDEKTVIDEFDKLYAKKEVAKETAKPKENENKKVEQITIDYLDKIQLKVAKVIKAEKLEGSDKLLKLQVSLGSEERQIVAGLQKYYAPEELVNKNVVIVANLKPAKLRGVESQGMVLAAGEDDIVKVLTVDGDIEAGAEIK